MKEIENLIHQFNDYNLHSLLRAKTRTFRLVEEKLTQLNDVQFSESSLFGEFKVNNDDLIVVVTAKVNKPLSERSGKKAQYTLGKKFLKDAQKYIAGFFIFYDDKGDFRFSLIYDIPLSTGKRDWSNFRRFTYFVSKDQTNKTFIKQFTEVDFTSLEKIIDAFSVEKVTKQFYQEIANWYFWALKKVKFPEDAEAEKNGKEISVIRLITRLIFIWFMKVRKLVPEELFNENKLKEILTDLKLNNDNYYKGILQNLFFATLNTKPEERRFTSRKKGYRGYSQDFGNHNVYRYEEEFRNSEEVIEKYFMPIPFLNGGLFECLDYKSKTRDERKYIDGFTSTKYQQPIVPNFLFFSDEKLANELNKDYGTTNKKYLVRGIINTLSMYNFTIDESDPNDADVALDPELLGKVFENLLASYNPETAKTARKSTGSYYTPRPIVDYMVDESLKQYFKTHLQVDDIDNKLSILFFYEEQENPFDETTTKKLVELIDTLRVVDPAVGSGAFPMRILNRLVFLLHKLDPDNSLWKQSQIEGIKKSVKDPILQRKLIEETERKFKEKNPDYGRKLYLIEKCIYGVDIQQIAVEIAKLRFFISLLVDEKIENGEIEPLPNLDFKLMQGNSLISSFAGIDFTTKPNNENALFDFDEQYKKLIAEFEELKSQYQNEPDIHKKRDLRDKIDAKLLEIFEEKLRQHYPQLCELESKYGKQKEILETEKKKLFKKIGIDLEQAEQDLIAYTEGRKPKDFFLWDVYFAEVFAEKGGFDIVIGNPPYVSTRTKDFDNSLKEYFKNYFELAIGQFDLFNLFIEESNNLIGTSGLLSFIVPKKLLTNENFESTRKFLLKNLRIRSYVDAQMPFESAGVEANVIINSREQITETSTYSFDGINIDFKFNVSNKLISLMPFNIYPFSIPTENILVINSILKKTNKRLGCYFNVIRGLECGFNHPSISKRPSKYKIIKGEHIQKYLIKETEWYVHPDFSDTKVFKSKDIFINVPKLVTKFVSNTIDFAIDEIGYFNTNVVYNVHPLIGNEKYLKYFLALLNSKLINFWFFNTYVNDDKLFPHIQKNQLDSIPVLLPDNLNQYEKLVIQILTLKKQNPTADTQRLEDQIDIMVYKLYNLTYEEVKIIDPEIEKIISKEEYEKYEIK